MQDIINIHDYVLILFHHISVTIIINEDSPHSTRGYQPLILPTKVSTPPESPLTVRCLVVVTWIAFWFITVDIPESTLQLVTIVLKVSVVVMHRWDLQDTFSSARGIAKHLPHIHHGRFPGGSGFLLDPSQMLTTTLLSVKPCDLCIVIP